MSSSPVSPPQGAQTADRAIGLLLTAVESPEPLGLSELARASGLSKQNTLRLLRTLVHRSLLAKEPGGHGYVAGTGLIALAGTVLRRMAVREVARPSLERIWNVASETVTLHVRHWRFHVCVDILESPHQVRRVVPLGEEVSLLEGTGSRSILPWLSEQELEHIFAWAAEEDRDVAALRRDVEHSRAQGYFAGVGSRVAGAGALSAPVFDALGVKGCVTVAGPENRFGMEAMQDLAPLVVRECAEISRALGYAAPPGAV